MDRNEILLPSGDWKTTYIDGCRCCCHEKARARLNINRFGACFNVSSRGRNKKKRWRNRQRERGRERKSCRGAKTRSVDSTNILFAVLHRYLVATDPKMLSRFPGNLVLFRGRKKKKKGKKKAVFSLGKRALRDSRLDVFSENIHRDRGRVYSERCLIESKLFLRAVCLP